MKYEQYENAIVERLQMKGIVTGAFPNENNLDTAFGGKPNVYVLLNGSTFGNPENLGGIAQMEKVHFAVVLFAFHRRGKSGMYALLEETSKRLLGYKLPGTATPITLDALGYSRDTRGVWQYELTFSFSTYSVQRDDEGETAPLIKQITNNLNSIVK
jgi:hypothetical protein